MFECEIEGFISGQKFRKVYEKKCEYLMVKYELRKIELDVLVFLDRYEDLNTAKDIVNQRSLSKAHVSKAVDNLTRRNFVIACTGDRDRRCYRLTLTKEAEPIIREMNNVWNQIREIIFADLTDEEIKVLKNAMTKITRNIEEVN